MLYQLSQTLKNVLFLIHNFATYAGIYVCSGWHVKYYMQFDWQKTVKTKTSCVLDAMEKTKLEDHSSVKMNK